MPGSATRCQTVAVMLNGCRVVLECLSLLPAVVMVCRSAGGQIFLPVVKFFDLMGSNFLTGSQIFLPPNKTPKAP